MADRYQDLSATALPAIEKQAYVHPGQLFFTKVPTVVTTILGPCVSVCLFDAITGAAGMNHYLLPERLGAASPRFGDVANELLLARFLQLDVPAARLQAKVFGGSMMKSVRNDLAQRNIDAAITFLEQNRVAIVARDVGGDRGRKLHFRTTDGAAWVRLL